MAKSTAAKSVKKETAKPVEKTVKAKAAPKAKEPAPVAKPAAKLTSPAAAKPITPSSAIKTKTISAQDRYHMIDEAAYYRAEKSGFQVDPHSNWVAAEKEIDELLAKQNIKVG